MHAHLAGQGHFGITQRRARRKQLLPRARFFAARHDALATAHRAAEHDALSVNENVLDHHHRIGAGRHSRAGHDLHTLAGADHTIEAAARFDFASAAERGAGNGVIGTQREAVANGSVEGRIIAIGHDRLR